MDSARDNYWREIGPAGLEVAPQSAPPPDLDQLILCDLDRGDERMPPLEILVKLAQSYGIKLRCAACRREEQRIPSLVYCRDCSRCFHTDCWNIYEDHTAQTTRDERCQGFSPLDLHLWMRHLHSPKKDDDEIIQQLDQDRPHRWIGISNNIDGTVAVDAADPKLVLYAALTKQFTDIDPSISMPAKQFPRLVSFFGDTGKGKSTIIQNLIRNIAFVKAERFATPVVGGSVNSTSGGIHIYCDPETFQEERPIVYADCEGLAGDSEPLANRFDNRFDDTHGRQTGPQITTTAATPISTMKLPWIKKESSSQISNSHWTSTVVSRIYPRFLYVFSDVVCYISDNPKSAEHDMSRLINWAHEARDFTTNQGVKPSLIYIINQDNHSEFSVWRDINHATQEMLKKWKAAKSFAEKQARWRERGAVVDTADELLRCYYRDVTVVFIPQFLPRHTSCGARDLQYQYDLLYREITRQSLDSSERRLSVGLLFDREMFSRSSIRVLEQLANNPRGAVDLKDLSEPLREQPTNFTSHVFNVLCRLQEQNEKQKRPDDITIGTEVRLIKKALGYLVACVAGGFLRAQGNISENDRMMSYNGRWKQVLDSFNELQCRCEETFGGRRCTNYRDRHTQGHQFELNGADRIRAGDFRSDFPEKINALHKTFIDRLKHTNIRGSRNPKIWAQELLSESRMCGVVEIVSNRTCLACLSCTPIHIMPCSHSICDLCATWLSTNISEDGALVSIHRCPFGCPQWHSRNLFKIRRKPTEAGVRTLALDGGGVRGIVELVILDAIMDRVGHNLPVQELFDVIMGTSTGGIIALGIFKKKWSVADATKHFEELVSAAFSTRGFLRPFIDRPGLHDFAQLFCNSLFRSEGIEHALKTVFEGGPSNLFGPTGSIEAETNKVAVIATGDEEERPVLMSNYNRESQDNDEGRNNLRREEKPEHELKIWEAGRCTSAAPTYFEPYKHPATGRIYTDGAMERNNPVGLADDERRFIWPRSSEHSRDLVISIGTGYSTDYHGMAERNPRLSTILQGLRRLGLISKIIMLTSVLANTLNCQKMWYDWKNRLGSDLNLLQKCHRVNIPYGAGKSLCGLDEVSKMKDIKAEALDVLSGKSRNVSTFVQDQLSDKLDLIARQLLASLFYLAIGTLETVNADTEICHGWIRCRLSRACQAQFQSLVGKVPAFRVADGTGTEKAIAIAAGGWDAATFSIPVQFRVSRASPEVRIKITLDNGRNWDEISGCPRNPHAHKSEDSSNNRHSCVM